MNQQLPQFIYHIVDRLRSIQGIAAISLGGSRARGNHTQKSDVDLGLYYKPENPPDLNALSHLACELDDRHRVNLITPVGEWGKWIDGGGWLKIEGISVDFLYRNLAQVNRVIALNEEYLLNEKGAVTFANRFALCPKNYQERVESVFALLSVDETSIVETIAILNEIEHNLSQWYGNRRLVM